MIIPAGQFLLRVVLLAFLGACGCAIAGSIRIRRCSRSPRIRPLPIRNSQRSFIFTGILMSQVSGAKRIPNTESMET